MTSIAARERSKDFNKIFQSILNHKEEISCLLSFIMNTYTSTISMVANLTEDSIHFNSNNQCFDSEGRIGQHQLCSREQCLLRSLIIQPLQCHVKLVDLYQGVIDNRAKNLVGQTVKKPFRPCLYNGAMDHSIRSQHILCTKKLCFVKKTVFTPLNCHVLLKKL